MLLFEWTEILMIDKDRKIIKWSFCARESDIIIIMCKAKWLSAITWVQNIGCYMYLMWLEIIDENSYSVHPEIKSVFNNN